MKNKDVSSLTLPIIRGFQKYSLTIFIVVLTAGLAIAVLLLNATLQQSSNTTGYTAPVNPTTFDQATIDRVKQLHTSTNSVNPVVLPTTRINPFSE